MIVALRNKTGQSAVSNIVNLLLEHGAVINIADRVGMTPLMYAITNDHIEVAKKIIPFAALEACDNEQNTVRISIFFFLITSNYK